jgi:hypothetical protein
MADTGLDGRRVRGYFAPVNRATGAPAVFDPAVLGRFAVGAAPAPWLDLGWCSGFKRTSETKVDAVVTGAPGTSAAQVRTQVGAEVSFAFETWGRLQLALAAGAQSLNLLKTAPGAAANGSGGVAEAPVALVSGSTASVLMVASTTGLSVGDLVAVDVDYTGQVGFVGTGVSGAYVKSSAAVGGDVNFIRRVTLNVGRLASIAAGALTLQTPLPAGVPAAGMQVSPMVGFCDREGGSFFSEWSGVFVFDGEQGDRVTFHYPRLQTMEGAKELPVAMSGGLERVRLAGRFRALPVVDGNDGETCVCYRSYLPATR